MLLVASLQVREAWTFLYQDLPCAWMLRCDAGLRFGGPSHFPVLFPAALLAQPCLCLLWLL